MFSNLLKVYKIGHNYEIFFVECLTILETIYLLRGILSQLTIFRGEVVKISCALSFLRTHLLSEELYKSKVT